MIARYPDLLEENSRLKNEVETLKKKINSYKELSVKDKEEIVYKGVLKLIRDHGGL